MVTVMAFAKEVKAAEIRAPANKRPVNAYDHNGRYRLL